MCTVKPHEASQGARPGVAAWLLRSDWVSCACTAGTHHRRTSHSPRGGRGARRCKSPGQQGTEGWMATSLQAGCRWGRAQQIVGCHRPTTQGCTHLGRLQQRGLGLEGPEAVGLLAVKVAQRAPQEVRVHDHVCRGKSEQIWWRPALCTRPKHAQQASQRCHQQPQTSRNARFSMLGRSPQSSTSTYSPRPAPSMVRQQLMLPALAWCGTPAALGRLRYSSRALRRM